jgi:hypothetical protein
MYELTTEQDDRIDWGKTAEDYAKYRPGPPPSFYQRLLALGIGLPEQQVLDLATGTGVIARQFAEQGCRVMASDIASRPSSNGQGPGTKPGPEHCVSNRLSRRHPGTKPSLGRGHRQPVFFVFRHSIGS